MSDIAAIAGKLSEAQIDFLDRVCSGRRLSPATRPEDRARQSLRRNGLVCVMPSPRRWEATDLGREVLDELISKEML
jgi:hypothetical protein